jgi:PAT family beta-lactamase induction signal transducer AmpG
MAIISPQTRLLALMGAYGFISGLPLSLTAFTLQLWFTTYGISVHSIGLTAWLGLPYTLKFLWSGFFDRMPPGRLAAMGRRRGWLILVQPALAVAAAAMALSDPGHLPALTVVAGFALAFLSATQDILIDAWRIETFPERLQGTALATYIWGYRGAMFTSTSGALWLSGALGWHTTLLGLAGVLGAGVLITLAAPAAAAVVQPARAPGWRASIEATFLAPLRDFLARPGAATVLAFVLLFRVGKVFADGTAAAFYRYGVGFTPHAIGDANAFGVIGLLAGTAAGGFLVLRLGTLPALLLTGLAQAASLSLYLALIATGPSEAMLTTKIVIESFAGAAADMAFLTYISALCARAYTATQYALLSSLAAVAFHTLGGLSGYAAEALGYHAFYAACIAASVPAMAVLLQIRRRVETAVA